MLSAPAIQMWINVQYLYFQPTNIEEHWASVGILLDRFAPAQALTFGIWATASISCDKALLWPVLHTPVEDQFVSWLLVLTVSIKPSLLCCLCFPFLYWIAQQAGSLCVWLIPLAHTPSPSAAVRWKGEGTAIDHFFPHTCTHTPHLQRHYQSTCLMFSSGVACISFFVILHLLPVICWHHDTSQSRHLENKKWSIIQPIIQTISDSSVSAVLF